MPSAIVVREIDANDLPPAVAIIARGMRDNPLHIAVFGRNPETRAVRLSRMFTSVLPMVLAKGVVVGAFDVDTLVGIAGILPPGRCQPSWTEKLALLPRIVPAVGGDAFVRVGAWTSTWAKHDPAEPHCHLGPIVVDAHLQRQGVGSVLMKECCTRMDRDHTAGYLETDKLENVAFYQRFGFEIVRSLPVLDTPNWFMRREATIPDP